MRKIKVILKRTDEQYGHVAWVSDTLENLQKHVGGNIEVYPIGAGAVIICNEEGKLLGLPKNFSVGTGLIKEVIVGDVIIAGTEGEEFADCPFSMKMWKSFLKQWGNV